MARRVGLTVLTGGGRLARPDSRLPRHARAARAPRARSRRGRPGHRVHHGGGGRATNPIHVAPGLHQRREDPSQLHVTARVVHHTRRASPARLGNGRGRPAGARRPLPAPGPPAPPRRALSAATAGALAILGVTLGTIGAYVALTAGYLSDLSTLGRVPIVHLLVLVIGTPIAAAVAGWLLAGREPPALARQPIA